ncbi:Piso0_004137 [Millerozyma farinosa CBS 7064]|uniref:Piso0_004137 protein n=1 Tax=Pichia sorbitophila (strain ATCC MYA-4447 / BCRC 22081 / CBS 7064 / NBRC 10061 / NRRL Y-12695) TaxID=559304 RepID=G8Y7K9_PICSO|nr:Piso0_004137 [Millerozyma farinosa CBS 7064]CCE84589.1 Piso0_004137 [Millerozyma farinosa CBS 7064]
MANGRYEKLSRGQELDEDSDATEQKMDSNDDLPYSLDKGSQSDLAEKENLVISGREREEDDDQDRLNIHQNESSSTIFDQDMHPNGEGIVTEGNSSNIEMQDDASNEHGNDNDLENQIQHRPLSARDRAKNVLWSLVPIKQTYDRINNGLTTGRMQLNVPGRFIGQGTDGVFRNLMAKPDRESTRIAQENHPPTYEEAAADAAPEYWESAIVSPMFDDEVFIEGLPVGNIANFVWNILVTTAFQFVGFVLCYLLHTSHAAKQGSRAGLGATFMYSGYNLLPSNFGKADVTPIKYIPSDPNQIDVNKSMSMKKGSSIDSYKSELASQKTPNMTMEVKTPYFAYGVIALGIFVVVKAFIDFSNIKRMESTVLAPMNSSGNTNRDTQAQEEGQ